MKKPWSHSVHWMSSSDQHSAVLQFGGGLQLEEGVGEGIGEGMPEHVVLSVVPFPGQGAIIVCPAEQGVQTEQTISLKVAQGAEMKLPTAQVVEQA